MRAPASEAAPARLRGVLPVLQTPFRDDDCIDEVSLAREVAWVAALGVDGVVTGMVSEVLRLHDSERERLTEVVCAAATENGLPAVVSTGAESTAVAVRLTKHAAAAGASGVMAIPPLTVALSDDGLSSYYRAIIEATDLEVVVQDASGYVGRPLSIGLMAALLADYPGQVSFKPEAPPIGPRLSRLRDATRGAARTFEGSAGAALVDSHRRGVVGTMPGTEIAWALVALWRALEDGDAGRARALSAPVTELASLCSTVDAYVAVEKYLLHKQGILPSRRQRGPVDFELDAELAAVVDSLYDELWRVAGSR